MCNLVHVTQRFTKETIMNFLKRLFGKKEKPVRPIPSNLRAYPETSKSAVSTNNDNTDWVVTAVRPPLS